MKQFMYEHLDEAKRHTAAIERLAACAHVQVEDVRLLYENILAKMLEEARIKTFLSVFTARRVEKILQNTRKTDAGVGNSDSSANSDFII